MMPPSLLGFESFPIPFAARQATWLFLLLSLACGCSAEKASPTSNTAASGPPSNANSSDQGSKATSIRFREITESLGVAWTYHNGEEAGNYSIVEEMGGGIALTDFDSDGRLDIVLAGGGMFPGPRRMAGLPLALFRQQPDGTFEDIAVATGLDGREYYHHGIAAGDYDHDGFPDFAITGYGGASLYFNQGDGTFIRRDEVQELFKGGWSTSAGWGDLNRDGYPDLVVVHYADWSFENDPRCPGPPPHPRDVCPPRRFHGLPDQIFLSDGQGSFLAVGPEIGFHSVGKGIGLAISDVDLDGDLDIYVANDTDPNDLFRNGGQGHFQDVGLAAGVALSADGNADGSMGIDIGDLNLDGLPDIWVTNFEREPFALYQNLGDCQFQHISRLVGISGLPATQVGWGTVLIDADGDGDEDLFVANGHVVRYPTQSTVRQLPVLLENQRGARYVNVAASTGEYFREAHPGRGVAMGDLDDDGDPDLVVTHVNEPVTILANESAEWHGIALRLIGRRSPRQPIGAIVSVTVGEQTITKQVKLATSYASTSAETIFFALGERSVSRIVIDWPSGTKQMIETIPAQSHWTIIEPP